MGCLCADWGGVRHHPGTLGGDTQKKGGGGALGIPTATSSPHKAATPSQCSPIWQQPPPSAPSSVPRPGSSPFPPLPVPTHKAAPPPPHPNPVSPPHRGAPVLPVHTSRSGSVALPGGQGDVGVVTQQDPRQEPKHLFGGVQGVRDTPSAPPNTRPSPQTPCPPPSPRPRCRRRPGAR